MEMSHAGLCGALEQLGWPSKAAADLADGAHIVSYEKDATIFHAGEPADVLYVLLSGEVKLYYDTTDGGRVLAAIVRSGQAFSLTDCSGGSPNGIVREKEPVQLFTTQALSRCRVAIIAKGRVARALHDLPAPELVRLLAQMNDQWVGMCRRLLGFLTMTVRSRLAYTITEIAHTFGIADARGTLIPLKLSHEDFAELVGASRPMVSRHLKELATAGIFTKQGGRYFLGLGRAHPVRTEGRAPARDVSPSFSQMSARAHAELGELHRFRDVRPLN